MDFKFKIPSGAWTQGWISDKKDLVLMNEEKAVVGLDFQDRCSGHSRDEFCETCLPKLQSVVLAARELIDPMVEARIEGLPSRESHPEYLGCLNPISGMSTPMRYSNSRLVSFRKPIYTSKNQGSTIPKTRILCWNSSCSVIDTHCIRAIFVRLVGDVSPAYMRQLEEAKLTFMIDGDRVIGDVPLRHLLGKKEVVLDRKSQGCLFTASPLEKNGEKLPAEPRFVGYMIPNGTNFEASLESVPRGAGLIHIEVGWEFPRYTQRVMS